MSLLFFSCCIRFFKCAGMKVGSSGVWFGVHSKSFEQALQRVLFRLNAYGRAWVLHAISAPKAYCGQCI